MKSLKLFLIFCLILLANLTANAQQIIKMPTSQGEIQKMATQKPVNRTIVLPAADKLKQIQAALAGKVEPSKIKNYSLDLPLKLDVRNSFVEGKAKLGFDLAAEVSSAENVVNFDSLAYGFEPRIRMFYNAPAPGFYVFDFTVENRADFDKSASIIFQYFLVDSQTKSLGKGVQHQIFVTEFKDVGWHIILLESKTSWNFYALEISQFK